MHTKWKVKFHGSSSFNNSRVILVFWGWDGGSVEGMGGQEGERTAINM